MISVHDGLVTEIAAGGRLSGEPSGDGSPAVRALSLSDSGESGCWRVHIESEPDLTASQSRLWRRLFRVLEDPLKPIVLLDGGSLSLFRVLQHVNEFAKSKELRSECNYVVVVPGNSDHQEELTGAIRQAVAEGELYGQCVDFVLDDYEAELPTMTYFTGRNGGVILTDNRSLTDPSAMPAKLAYRLEPVVASESTEPARLSSDRRPLVGLTRRESSPAFPADTVIGGNGKPRVI